MKEFGILLLIFISLIFLSLGIDFSMKVYTKNDILQDIIITSVYPFRVTDITEVVIIILLILWYLIEIVRELVKKFKKDGNGIGKVNREE